MFSLASLRDYCEAPCTDRVPKVSAKKVLGYLNLTEVSLHSQIKK